MATKSDKEFIVIADSSGLVALVSPVDLDHKKAVSLKQKLSLNQATILIPAEIFSETINIMGKKMGHEIAINAADIFINSGLFIIIPGIDSYPLALEKFQKAAGSVSFTDCLVMAMADSYKTQYIFGFDRVFAQGGYKISF